MTRATLNTANAEYIGHELQIDAGRLDLPDGATLPKELNLHSVHVRRRGVYVGRRWYLQAPGGQSGTAVDLVSPVKVEGSQDVCEAFLRLHGYRAKGADYPDAMEFVRD